MSNNNPVRKNYVSRSSRSSHGASARRPARLYSSRTIKHTDKVAPKVAPRREFKPKTKTQELLLESVSPTEIQKNLAQTIDSGETIAVRVEKPLVAKDISVGVRKSLNQTVKQVSETPLPNHDTQQSSVTLGVTATQTSTKSRAPKQSRHKKTRKKKVNHAKRQTVGEHIDEFRRRLLYCVVALVIGGVIGYRFQDKIIAWLVKPLGQQLFYTSPTGGFDFLIKICLFFGFLLAIPVIIYNFIRFLAPAVPERVSYSTVKLLLISMVLALMGVAFAYYVSLPAALHFLNNFTNDQIQSLISAQEYFNFVMLYLAGFAALFQMPLIFAFINKVTPLKPSILMQKQRIVILVSFIVAAILTPTPDPMNQTLMAIPIIGLYQTSVGVVWQDNRRKRRKQAKNRQVASDTELAVA